MKMAERIVMVLIILCFIAGGAWLYFSVRYQQQSVHDAVARGEYQIPVEESESNISPQDWRKIYPNVVPLNIGDVSVLASVASTKVDIIKGLSNTPFLPDNVVKLFVFGTNGSHSIWMKDMKYSIDIIWATEEGVIVHFEENVSPDSFPESFSSPVPAWYVVETNAGFVNKHEIKLGDKILLINQN